MCFSETVNATPAATSESLLRRHGGRARSLGLFFWGGVGGSVHVRTEGSQSEVLPEQEVLLVLLLVLGGETFTVTRQMGSRQRHITARYSGERGAVVRPSVRRSVRRSVSQSVSATRSDLCQSAVFVIHARRPGRK